MAFESDVTTPGRWHAWFRVTGEQRLGFERCDGSSEGAKMPEGGGLPGGQCAGGVSAVANAGSGGDVVSIEGSSSILLL